MAINASGSNFTNTAGQIQDIGVNGTGAFNIDGGSQVIFNGPVAGSDHFLGIGTLAGDVGTLTITGAGSKLGWIDAPGAGSNGFAVGDSGNGTLTVSSGANIELLTPDAPVGEYTGFSVASQSTAVGNATFDNSSVDVSGWGAYTNVARRGGDATMTFQNSAVYNSDAVQEAGMQVGREAGATGVLNIASGSVVNITAGIAGKAIQAGSFAGVYFNLGRDGGTGTINADAGALNLASTVGEAGMNIGRATSANGTFNLVNSSTFRVDSDFTGAGLLDEADTYLNVGRNGGTAALNASGSSIILDGDDDSQINVGRDGGTGTVSLDGSTMSIDAGDFARLRIGVDFGTPGGNGTLTLQNGSTLTLDGKDAGLSAAYNSNSTGTINILSGSTATVTKTGGMDDDAYFRVGYQANSVGTATIDGAGSRVTSGTTNVGSIDLARGTTGDTTSGSLTISNGGTLQSETVEVGRGGAIHMQGGTLNATGAGLFVEEGAVRALAGSVNAINGDVSLSDSSSFEFVIASGQSLGKVSLTSTNLMVDGFKEIISTTGYTFTAGETHEYLVVAADNLTSVDSPDDAFLVTGQTSDFAWLRHEVVGAGPNVNLNISFVAMSNSDGSNKQTAGFDINATEQVDILYESDILEARGSLGTSEDFESQNVTSFAGSAGGDMLTITGSGGGQLFGNGGADMLTGGNGNDVLDGGTGSDTMTGGLGDDAYYVENFGDVIVENAGEGTDSVYSAFDSYTLQENFEIGYITTVGSIANDTQKTLAGDGDRDFLFGFSGDDILQGFGGADVMQGFGGDDVYEVDNSSDAVIEAAGGGFDNVFASVDYLIGDDQEIESAILTGNATVLRGSDSDNQLIGNSQVNVLEGKLGTDYLLGGGGDDIFQVSKEANATDLDVFGDFEGAGVVGGDRIAFSAAEWGADGIVYQVSQTSFIVARADNTNQQQFIIAGLSDPTTMLLAGDDYYFG